jgi:hypothetical protein
MQQLLISIFAALMLFIGARYLFILRRRHANPKDYGYSVVWTFGPGLKLPPLERLKKKLPWVGEGELEDWLSDYKNVDRLVDDLSRQGGPKRLGRKAVEGKLKTQFPFLHHEGLSQAVFLAAYLAMKEGYDREAKQ